MIVNTASYCGNTPQYKGLQTLYDRFKAKGFVVLAFPSNDFGNQEPGSNQEIRKFCSANYAITFPLFSKTAVKGEKKAPLFRYLTDRKTNPKYGGEIEWNFAKFLIARDGSIVGRFRAGEDPLSDSIVKAVEKQLSRK
jgi:Glutathione peroxidase